MSQLLRNEIAVLISNWEKIGLPGRTTLNEMAESLLKWRSDNDVPGLWKNPVKILGATLDDAWGVGIELILKYARAIGAETEFLGLLVSRQDIINACRTFQPDYLGLTVLQFDTEDDLVALRESLPPSIKIIAGGPVFQFDPELQQRAGIDFVAKDLSAFLRFMLDTA